MKDFTTISRIYFIGIGGIGMSALARYFLSENVVVSGYDKTSTSLTRQLEAEGMHIHYDDNPELIDKNADLVVYTPAIPKDQKEYNYYKNNNYELEKRSDVLQQITKDTFNICIAGTHGKTTITTMIAHILRQSGFGCSAFLGGISVNYNTNFWSSDNGVSVVEADEYDRSFLKLSPNVAVITAMDADHLDIYGTKENMVEAFAKFANQLKPNGLLLTKYGLPEKEYTAFTHLRYSLQNADADVHASDITMKSGGYEFDVTINEKVFEKVKLNMGGMHNVENAVAAIMVADYLEVDPEKIKESIATFKGVKRRFEYIIDVNKAEKQKNNVVLIDDYAHHPQELNALVRGAKSLFEKRECTVIFQPHLYSRTKDFVKQFAGSLDMADRILILPIYPARELPIEGVTSELILQEMKNKNATVISKEGLLEYIGGDYLQSVHENSYGDVLIVAGAGDIDRMVQPINEILEDTF